MNIPTDLKYAKTHEWVRRESDGCITVGITDHAQEMLGDLVYIELPEVGKNVAAGAPVAVVESVKAASDLYAPVEGTVTAVNQTAADAPERVNADAYGTWLFRMQPANPAEIDGLLDAEGYRAVIEG
jgi:glycine cleavage system H protein